MRPLEFRAWHKLNRLMYSVSGLSYNASDGSLSHICTGSTIFGKNLLPLQCFPLRDMELMQFTGLLDRNGNEVYEGDIVRGSNIYSSSSHIFEVFWREKFTGFFLKEVGAVDEQREWIDLMHGGNVADLEVIGNIYETAQSAG